MAQLKDSLVTGSLRVTDTIYTTNETISSLTASAAVVSDANKKLVSRTILNNTSATAVTGSDSLITANTLVNAGYVKSSGVTSITIQTTSPLSGGSATATTSTGSYTIAFSNQAHNTVLAGPSATNASATAPSFRTLVAADIPYITTASDTSNELYMLGVTSSATTTVKYNSGVKAKNGAVTATTYNALTLTAATTGFTIAGGTTSKTLTVAGTATINAPTQGGVVYGGASGAYSSTSAGTSGQLLQSAGTSTPTWITATDSNTASTIVKRDASGNFSAGTITAALIGDVTGNVSGSSGSCTGNADTATRINGNLTQLGNVSTGHNIWVSSNNTGSGIPNIIAGVYIVPNSKTIVASNFQGNATTATTAVSLETTTSTISGGSSGTHAQALQTYFNNNKASTPRNKLLAFYDSTSGNGSITFGYFLNGYDSNPYGGFFSAHYGTPYYIGINNGTFTQSQLWKAGDSVTGAVWNDYAEYRRANTTEPGRCVEENDNGTLTLTKYRLIPGASIISDTWGFSQGESEEAKTPVAVSGRVLAYPCRNRDKYHAGQAVCSGPNGTVDIMTRREIQEYPDAIIGIVSEIPDYEEWGGGDRDPVKVNGRIWIKVR